MDFEDRPVRKSDAATQLGSEALDSLSQDELLARIALLEAEILRVRAHHAQVADRRRAADALFSKPIDG